ncbi:heme lyase CcmF/NrfE family subunit [uncultured Paludibaculum sp.]|uniref:heme lyase CcmF/NrfE family subunit n=1 Tax=uncultured Paludibaculum sp. TaxID=1765020 RepID=UPI002AABA16D|nr:heme lyase CcmF/NrfE family subunit [uncultured Paludibaculum sp.]
METLGAFAILLAFCLAIYAFSASLVGSIRKRAFLVVSGERAVYGVWILMTTAAGILVYSLMTSDFRLAYVAARSNRAMPMVYKFAAWWGGQEGSLLLWSWLLSTFSVMVLWTNRHKFRDMMPYVIAVLSFTQIFFCTLNAFVEPPFQVLAVGRGVQAVADGNGLNPLLQHPAMAIHPPMLYLGYVGFIVPFAFAFASLVTKQPGEKWIATTRRWSLITWAFQSTGILLGAGWAYAVLGWGGYWGWDPVENASLLPWITATAFLHSVMMQEKKGMMKVWNMVLIASTFFLCIFGTFLTRSGVVSSVHAFAQSSLGSWFLGYLAIAVGITTFMIIKRLDYLKSEAHLESVLSRESSFLFNNLILLASSFAVLWGTLFPVLTEAVMGEKITVGAPFFNKVNIPIGLFLLLLTGVGPLIAWRRSSWDSLKRAFRWPTIAFALTIVGLVASGIQHIYALISFGLCAFVTVTIVMEFWKGSRAIAIKNQMNLIRAMVELTHRNTRRYGGYLVHMGIVIMFIGFTGAAFNKDTTREVKIGEHIQLGNYDLQVKQVLDGDNPNYSWQRAVIGASKNGEPLGDLTPERRVYVSSQQPTSQVSIRRRLNEDLYLNFASMSQTDANAAIIQVYIFPLVSCIWVGFYVLLFGTLICLVPSKVKYSYARTEVVGVYAKQAQPTK